MRLHQLLTLLALAAPALAQNNPYVRAGAQVGVITDLRARNVGDILTITIQETTTVKNEDKVERRNDTSLAARLEAYTLSDKTFSSSALPKIDIRKESDFQGESKQNSGSDVRASVAVIVVDVQPNGNLVVAGTRTVTVNDESRTLKISGLVRALDVTSENTVGSAQVADARISIAGTGAGTRQVTRGPVGQLFDTIIWAAWPF
ncbi:MAG: flagellar basal body L-ring protein FlgH [Planctomycetes bacterium]|nr:flagellar basal body L-ring protein FlgH [Planctomycetota bacterium]MCB9884569.1 flagellar basal body L-ring protein FlgH [Planctomycetota bacterium]